MTNHTFVLKDEKAFASGAFENTAYADGALRLEQYAGRYVQAGCYTTPEISAPAFNALVASWNAATPAGTAVELAVRVFAAGAWTPWMPYGKWSPFLRRASLPVQHPEDAAAYLDTDMVNVRAPGGASLFQLRASLYTDDVRRSPSVYLLAASVRPTGWQRETGEALQHRCVPVPAYSQLIRDPRIGSVICSPTTVTMLMNRWGEDLLPEEVAHANYDYTYAGNGNWSFTTAIAGCYGYECYVAFADIAGLKKEIKNGFACGVSVHYADTPEHAEERGLPLLEGTTGCTDGHLMVVRGFETGEDGTEYVLVNDPYAPGDAAAQRRYRLDQFAHAWGGVAYFIHGKDGARRRPARACDRRTAPHRDRRGIRAVPPRRTQKPCHGFLRKGRPVHGHGMLHRTGRPCLCHHGAQTLLLHQRVPGRQRPAGHRRYARRHAHYSVYHRRAGLYDRGRVDTVRPSFSCTLRARLFCRARFVFRFPSTVRQENSASTHKTARKRLSFPHAALQGGGPPRKRSPASVPCRAPFMNYQKEEAL